METFDDTQEIQRRKQETALLRTQELGLPLPRFQFTWIANSDDWTAKECIYTLVLPLREHDIRSENENGERVRTEYHCKLGTTICTGGKRPVYGSRVDAPFRDGAHAKWDAEALCGLPIYAVCENDSTRLPE